MYYAQYEKYPGPTSSYGESEPSPCGGWDTANVDNDSDGKAFIEPLVDSGIMKSMPKDPIGTGTCGGYTYRYYRYSAGSMDAIQRAALSLFWVLLIWKQAVTLIRAVRDGNAQIVIGKMSLIGLSAVLNDRPAMMRDIMKA